MTARWITAALLLLASPVVGQEEEPELYVGARVRVTAPTVSQEPLVGTYWGFKNGQTLAIKNDKTDDPLDIPASEVEGLEISAGKSSRAWFGAGLGFAAFAVAGWLGTDAFCRWPGPLGSGEDESCEWEAAGVGVLTGLVGAGIGALIGSQFKSDNWQPVELPAKPMVAVHPTGRFSVGVSIPLRR